MKHKKAGRKLSRIRKQRRALLKTLLWSFILKKKINTTEAKAKEKKALTDRIINKSKAALRSGDSSRSMRILKKLIPEKAAQKITADFLKRFENRNSGYTRIIKLKQRRSDGAKIAVIEFV